MKRILIIILTVMLAFSGCSVTNESINVESSTDEIKEETLKSVSDYEAFFSKNEIHEINIEISEEDFLDILENPLDEEFHEASVTLDGVTVSNVAFRTKGNSTLRDVANLDSERYSFKIKVNEYEDQKLLGLDEFVLNNMFSDASYLREYISYEAMAANGLDVPLASFVNVSVNGELYGFYLLVESVDDSFLNRSFGDNDGNLYRADLGTLLEVKDGEYIENVSQKNGDDESKDDLHELMDILNDMPDGEKGDIESVLDVESALRYIAVNTLLENYDSLNGKHLQNYYLYNDGGIFVVIPWDFNMSFGGFGGEGQSTVDIDNPVSGTSEVSPLITNLLGVDEYKKLYYSILEEYIEYFSEFENNVTELADLIRESVEEDPSKFTTIDLFESNVVYQENGKVEVAAMKDMDKMPGDENKAPGNRKPNKEAGGMESGNDVSIINVLLARMENIQLQLLDK